MPYQHAKELVPFLKRRAGTHLRGVLYYDDEGTRIIYLRADIDTARLEEKLPHAMHRLRQETLAKEQEKFPFSNLEATVRLFDDAVAVHLIQGENHGTVVTLDPEGTTVIRGFLRECLDRL